METDFSLCLKKKLKQTGMTQYVLSEKVHVCHQAVSKWMNNQCLPDIQTVKSMCKLFSSDDILDAYHSSIKKREINKNFSHDNIRIKELNSFEAAKKHVKHMIKNSCISNYSHVIQKLFEWFAIGVIGHVYYEYCCMEENGINPDEDFFGYNNVFFLMSRFFNKDATRLGLIDNLLDFVFRDFDCRLNDKPSEEMDNPKMQYALKALGSYKNFQKAYEYKTSISCEFKVAVTEFIEEHYEAYK